MKSPKKAVKKYPMRWSVTGDITASKVVRLGGVEQNSVTIQLTGADGSLHQASIPINQPPAWFNTRDRLRGKLEAVVTVHIRERKKGAKR